MFIIPGNHRGSRMHTGCLHRWECLQIDPRSGILGQSECVFVILKDTAELPYTEVKRELYNLKS